MQFRQLATRLSVSNLPALIHAEYDEMPGLRLTIPQAARLWNVDLQRCQQALDSLAQEGFLSRIRDSYVRRDSTGAA